MKKVSVIMPAYNRGYIISRAIESVINQTYTEWELIIVDDGSEDDTEKRVAEFKDDRIRYIHYDENRGGNYARNLGMKNSVGEYIAFLDSDCEWYSDYLRKSVCLLEDTNEKNDIVFSRSCVIHDNIETIFPFAATEEIDTEEKMLNKSVIESIFDTNVCIIDRKVYRKSGGFNESLRKCQDWDYFLRLLSKKCYKFRFNDEVLCKNYIQKNSIFHKDEFFWDARLHIFEKHIDICREINTVPEVLLYMLRYNPVECILPDQAERLFSVLNAEEKAVLCKNHHKDYLEKIQIYNDWKDDYNNLYNNSNKNYNLAMKNEKIIKLQKKWIQALNAGKKSADYFHKNNINKICIYGFGVLGSLMWEELKDSDIQISNIIDAHAKSDEVNILTLEEVNNFECDVIVITAVSAVEEISEKLREKTDIKVISIEEIFENL